MTQLTKPHFLPYLDGLRGLAALVVFFGHLACSYYPALTSGSRDLSGLKILHAVARSPLSILTAANSSVCIFFVLSGFVMAMVANRSKESFIAISARRYIRLAGPAAAACLLSAFLLKHHLYFNQKVADITASSWLKQWFLFDGHYHIALKEGLYSIFSTPGSTYDSSLWTMYTELWGSFAIFACYLLVKNNALRLLSFVLAAFISAKYFNGWEFFCIFAGASTYNLHQQYQFALWQSWMSTFCIFIGLFLCAYPDFAPGGHGGWFYNWANTSFRATSYHSIGGLLIVYFIRDSNLFRNFFSSAPLLWLGNISFSLYLVHLPVICSVGSLLVKKLHHPLSYNVMTLTVIPVIIITSLALAVAFNKLVDKSFIQLGRWVSKKIDLYFPTRITSSAEPITEAA